MNIVVCVKPVVKLAEKTTSRENSKLGITNADKSAIFESLKLKSSVGAYVTVVSMSTLNSADVLEQLFLYGVDEIILLSHARFAGSDTFATAYGLGTLIKSLPKCDLVLMGRKSDDSETGQVPPALAYELNMPYISNGIIYQCSSRDEISICRKFDTCTAFYKLKMPAVISVTSQMIDLCSLTFSQLAYQNKQIKVINDLSCDKNKIGIQGSKTRVVSQHNKSIGYRRNIEMLDLTSGSDLISEKIRELRNG